MTFLNKIKAAYEPWNDPDLSEQGKKFWSDPKNQKAFLNSKAVRDDLHTIRNKTLSLLSAIKIYLSDLEDCPEDTSMVKVDKVVIEKLIKEANELKTLEAKWYAHINKISDVFS